MPAQSNEVATAVRTNHTAPLITVHLDDRSLRDALDVIARQAGLTPYYTDVVSQSKIRVSLHVKNVNVMQAFDQVLNGTPIKATLVSRNVLFEEVGVAASSGVVTGRVFDAQTKQPLSGASVVMDDNAVGVRTGKDGSFRFASVTAGTHRMTVRLIGYRKETQTTTVPDNESIAVDVALQRSVGVLDQVVVTGTVIPTELRAVPSAVTVITAKQIEERGITQVQQLFRGDVPGLFAQNNSAGNPLDAVTMYSRGVTSFEDNAHGNVNTNPIKTFVDGVEMADPRYLSQIDPRSIERIEILTGPQASTIYGSNALNGVMQIFTKRGTTNAPQLTFNLLSGVVQNNFSDALAPQHDYSGQLAGVEGRISYNAGGSWTYLGPWSPARQTSVLSAFGGTRLVLPTQFGPVTTDVSLRQSHTRNQEHGGSGQIATQYQQSGWWQGDGMGGRSRPRTAELDGRTLGLTVGYAPSSWWSHELSVGQDASNTEWRTQLGYVSTSDTLVDVYQEQYGKRSLRYTTTARVPVTSVAQATVTLGTDAWQSLTSTTYVSSRMLTGSLGSGDVTRLPTHNTGAFVQAQLGLLDQLFLTYGLRAEWNPNYGEDAQPNYAPRYGLAYTADIGLLTAKLRASYGRATHPPTASQKLAVPSTDEGLIEVYGPYNFFFANSELGPEYQQGGEGGLELYLGNRASLVVTRYNQTVDGLIMEVTGADSVLSLQPNPVFFGFLTTANCIAQHWGPERCSSQDATGRVYGWVRQNLNAVSLRNQGWELQGSVTTGPFTSRATYSWTKSRSLGITPSLRSRLTGSRYSQYAPGSTFRFLPEHTWMMGTTYAVGATTVALNVMGTGKVATGYLGDAVSLKNLDAGIRLQQNRLNVGDLFNKYISFNPSYALADLNASHRFSARLEGVLQVQNLANYYVADAWAIYASMGRQTKAGLRLRL